METEQNAELERLRKDNQRLREKLDKLLLKKPTGPRAQVVTLADCVETNEGYFYGLRAQEAEERELNALARVGKLEQALWAIAAATPAAEPSLIKIAQGALNDGSQRAD